MRSVRADTENGAESGEVQRGDEEEEGRAAKPPRDPLERRRQHRSPRMPCRTGHAAAGAPTASAEEAEVGSTEQTRGQARTTASLVEKWQRPNHRCW